MGTPKGMPRNTGKTIPDAAFRRMWFDLSLSVGDIGAKLGICQQAVTQRAKVRGLPARKPRGGQPVVDQARFCELYAAGVAMVEIARAMGFDRKTAHNTVVRLGLPRRGSGNPSQWITLAEYNELQLREAMARDAQKCWVQFKAAEMLDGRQDGRWPIGRAA